MDREPRRLEQRFIDVLREVKDLEKDLPFELLGFDVDNGSEFLTFPSLALLAGPAPAHRDDAQPGLSQERSRALRAEELDPRPPALRATSAWSNPN